MGDVGFQAREQDMELACGLEIVHANRGEKLEKNTWTFEAGVRQIQTNLPWGQMKHMVSHGVEAKASEQSQELQQQLSAQLANMESKFLVALPSSPWGVNECCVGLELGTALCSSHQANILNLNEVLACFGHDQFLIYCYRILSPPPTGFFWLAYNSVSCRLFVDAIAWSPDFAQDNTYYVHQTGTPRISSKPIDAHRDAQSQQAIVVMEIQS